MKRGRQLGARKTPERIFLEIYKEGEYFYSNKADKDLQAIASVSKVRIKTERLISIHPDSLKTERLTRVTVIGRDYPQKELTIKDKKVRLPTLVDQNLINLKDPYV